MFRDVAKLLDKLVVKLPILVRISFFILVSVITDAMVSLVLIIGALFKYDDKTVSFSSAIITALGFSSFIS